MKPQDPDFSKHSRLAQHLALLELDDQGLAPEDTAAEARVIDRMVPKPLSLSRREKSRKLFYLAPILMAAAGIGLMLFQNAERDANPWQIKGGGHVQIYVEEEGYIQAWDEARPLTPQARIKAEVFSEAPAVAFWGVSSRAGQLLQEPDWIMQNKIVLEAQEKKFFAGSLQLDGPSEGEYLCVVVCPVSLLNRLTEPNILQDLTQAVTSKVMPQGNLTACKNTCFQLRP